MESPVQVSRNRTAFHRELEHVQEEVLVLGSMVEKAVLSRRQNPSLARTTK